MAGLYEKFGRVAEAEATYTKVTELNPTDIKACGALAAFYNKALWDERGGVFVENQSTGSRRSKFDIAIATLEKCAQMAPADPSGYQKVATFYWDKAYRDPNLSDAQKDAYANKGIEAVNKALEIKPDYWEAIIYKGLLYREKAKVAPPAERKRILDDAQLFQKQAMDLRKEQQAAASGGAEGVPPEAAAAPQK
jgi:tetratricopeptide (TPR) repeat protein